MGGRYAVRGPGAGKRRDKTRTSCCCRCRVATPHRQGASLQGSSQRCSRRALLTPSCQQGKGCLWPKKRWDRSPQAALSRLGRTRRPPSTGNAQWHARLNTFISAIRKPIQVNKSACPYARPTPQRPFGGQIGLSCRDPVPEKQARRVLLSKWEGRPADSKTPDTAIANRFRETFAEPLSSSKVAAMRELFPNAQRCTMTIFWYGTLVA